MRSWVWHHKTSIKNHRSSQEKIPNLRMNYVGSSLDACDDQKAENEFMCLKQTSRNVCEQKLGNWGHDDFNSLFNNVCLLTIFNRSVEKSFHISQRILVHWINSSKISNNKVQHRSSFTNLFVGISSLSVVFFNNCCWC